MSQQQPQFFPGQQQQPNNSYPQPQYQNPQQFPNQGQQYQMHPGPHQQPQFQNSLTCSADMLVQILRFTANQDFTSIQPRPGAVLTSVQLLQEFVARVSRSSGVNYQIQDNNDGTVTIWGGNDPQLFEQHFLSQFCNQAHRLIQGNLSAGKPFRETFSALQALGNSNTFPGKSWEDYNALCEQIVREAYLADFKKIAEGVIKNFIGAHQASVHTLQNQQAIFAAEETLSQTISNWLNQGVGAATYNDPSLQPHLTTLRHELMAKAYRQIAAATDAVFNPVYDQAQDQKHAFEQRDQLAHRRVVTSQLSDHLPIEVRDEKGEIQDTVWNTLERMDNSGYGNNGFVLTESDAQHKERRRKQAELFNTGGPGSHGYTLSLQETDAVLGAAIYDGGHYQSVAQTGSILNNRSGSYVETFVDTRVATGFDCKAQLLQVFPGLANNAQFQRCAVSWITPNARADGSQAPPRLHVNAHFRYINQSESDPKKRAENLKIAQDIQKVVLKVKQYADKNEYQYSIVGDTNMTARSLLDYIQDPQFEGVYVASAGLGCLSHDNGKAPDGQDKARAPKTQLNETDLVISPMPAVPVKYSATLSQPYDLREAQAKRALRQVHLDCLQRASRGLQTAAMGSNRYTFPRVLAGVIEGHARELASVAYKRSPTMDQYVAALTREFQDAVGSYRQLCGIEEPKLDDEKADSDQQKVNVNDAKMAMPPFQPPCYVEDQWNSYGPGGTRQRTGLKRIFLKTEGDADAFHRWLSTQSHGSGGQLVSVIGIGDSPPGTGRWRNTRSGKNGAGFYYLVNKWVWEEKIKPEMRLLQLPFVPLIVASLVAIIALILVFALKQSTFLLEAFKSFEPLALGSNLLLGVVATVGVMGVLAVVSGVFALLNPKQNRRPVAASVFFGSLSVIIATLLIFGVIPAAGAGLSVATVTTGLGLFSQIGIVAPWFAWPGAAGKTTKVGPAPMVNERGGNNVVKGLYGEEKINQPEWRPITHAETMAMVKRRYNSNKDCNGKGPASALGIEPRQVIPYFTALYSQEIQPQPRLEFSAGQPGKASTIQLQGGNLQVNPQCNRKLIRYWVSNVLIQDYLLHDDVRGGGRITAMDCANERHLAGKFAEGQGTQEEALARFTNLVAGMPAPAKDMRSYPKRAFTPGGSYFDPIGGGYVVRDVTPFEKANQQNPRPRAKTDKLCDVAVVVAPDLRQFSVSEERTETQVRERQQRLAFYQNNRGAYISAMERAVRISAEAALTSNGNPKILVLGALGSGAFENNPYLVAAISRAVLSEDRYQSLIVDFNAYGAPSDGAGQYPSSLAEVFRYVFETLQPAQVTQLMRNTNVPVNNPGGECTQALFVNAYQGASQQLPQQPSCGSSSQSASQQSQYQQPVY